MNKVTSAVVFILLALAGDAASWPRFECGMGIGGWLTTTPASSSPWIWQAHILAGSRNGT